MEILLIRGLELIGQVKSIFTDLEMKGMFAVPKGIGVGILKVRIPLRMSINERDITQYERSIELITNIIKEMLMI